MPVRGAILTSASAFPLTAVLSGNELLTVFLWFAGAAVIALGGFYVAVAVRRWTQREEPVETFTIQALRDMRARGHINDAEFTAMRATLLAQLDLEDEHDAPTPPPPHDADEPGPPDDNGDAPNF